MATTHDLGKIGLVLPGGFLRGAFQVGALRAIREFGIRPAYIVGVSVGALNGAAFAAGKLDELVDTYWRVSPHPAKFIYDWNLSALFHFFSHSDSVFSNIPLHRLIEETIDFASLVNSPTRLDIVTTDFQDGAEVVFSTKNPAHRDPELLTRALLGSAAMPVVFPPFERGGHQLFDGGIIAENPISHAIREGCDTIFVILTDASEHVRTKMQFRTMAHIARRTGNLFSWRATKKDIRRGNEINQDLDELERIKRDIALEIAKHDRSAALQEAVTAKFQEARFSFSGKRRVALHIIEPEAEEDNTSYTMFHLRRRTVPEYIADGDERMAATLLALGLERPY
ncbi:hypothetical protein C4552_04490 [Candidatus Parcubacteria bacterium]|nr:MAG: hypothetical protein C4552_04490 [Candidatus Parcubacteria bacterium]